jgi:hypothetical protein
MARSSSPPLEAPRRTANKMDDTNKEADGADVVVVQKRGREGDVNIDWEIEIPFDVLGLITLKAPRERLQLVCNWCSATGRSLMKRLRYFR